MKKRATTNKATDQKLESLARTATKTAYARALASGHSVLVARNGEIRRIMPDGTSTVVKRSEPNVPVLKGTVIRIK